MRAKLLMITAMLGASAVTFSAARAQALNENIVIADTPKMTRWAAVHVVPDEAAGEPYFHVEIFEHEKGAQPWAYKFLSRHMAITGAALEKSRIRSKAKTYNYKDVEFRILYESMRDKPVERAKLPVCETSIDDCLKKAAAAKD
ncbi:DUF5086 family protein [Brucella sp. BE17]|uniref:DUF5086 family protein n=1 Tax=Brucella sp. BE17 TaxID=3142977 RepID=UPI0031BA9B94